MSGNSVGGNNRCGAGFLVCMTRACAFSSVSVGPVSRGSGMNSWVPRVEMTHRLTRGKPNLGV